MEEDGVDKAKEDSLRKMGTSQKFKEKNNEFEKLKQVPFGDLLRPIFSVQGEIKGV